MSREELKEIIIKVLTQLTEAEGSAPRPACIFSDEPCDSTTDYGIDEEG